MRAAAFASLVVVLPLLPACSDADTGGGDCLAGSRICEGTWVMLCHPKTNRFEPEVECPDGWMCLGGECIDTVFTDNGLPPDTNAPPDVPSDPGTPDPGYTPDPGRPDPGPPDQGPPDPGPPDPGALDPGLPDPGRPDPGSPDPGPPDPGPNDPGSPDPGAPDPGAPDPGMPDPGPPDPGPPDPGQPDPGPPDPGPPDPGPPDPGPPDPGPPDPGPPDPGPVDPGSDVPVFEDPFDPGPLAYEKIANLASLGNVYRVKWHTSGTFAVLLGSSGRVLRYTAADASLVLETTLGTSVASVEVSSDGAFFLILGTESDGEARLWRATLEAGGSLSFAEELTIPNGTPAEIERHPNGSPWCIGLRRDTNYINDLHLWVDGSGLTQWKAYNGGGYLTTLMWGDPAIYAGSDIVITGEGWNGAASRTWVLATDDIVTNGFPFGGNPGGAAWRPGGGYGIITATSTNKVRVYDGSWTTTTMPNTGTASTPNAVAWRANGTRALVVGRAAVMNLTNPPYSGLAGNVIEHRPGLQVGYDSTAWVNVSITDFTASPWLADSSTHFFDVDWRPAVACDEGLIVGSDTNNMAYGLVIRFYDVDDPACAPLP